MIVAVSLVAFALVGGAQDAPSRQQAVFEGVTTPKVAAGAATSLAEQMARLRVPGCAIAVIRDFEIDWVAGYGVRDSATGANVTADTLFQAGSISKPVFATVLHRLAQDRKLDLEKDVRSYLKSWQLPENEHSKAHALTLTALASHTGSTTIHGFLGYTRAQRIPTLPEILNGAPPSNSGPIVMDGAPGTFRYSGGGTTMLQLAIEDVTGKGLPELARTLVFEPLGMKGSTYEQPLPIARFPDFSAGHLEDGLPAAGKFHVHPEQAAAGLWISARDLATLACDWLKAAAGKPSKVLSAAQMKVMLAPVGRGETTAGFFLDQIAGATWFQHGGSNIGFKNQFYGCAETGDGFVIFTNGEAGGGLMALIQASISRVYGFGMPEAEVRATTAAPADELDALAGRYEVGFDGAALVARDGDHLTVRFPPFPARRLSRIGEREYFVFDRGPYGRIDDIRLIFDEIEDGVSEGLTIAVPGKQDYALREDDAEGTVYELAIAGDFEGADAKLRALLEERKDAGRAEFEGGLEAMVWSLLADGEIELASWLCASAIEMFPTSAQLHTTMSRVALSRGDRAAAKAACTKVLELSPAPPNGVEDFGRAASVMLLRDLGE
jgi:CubicO group peptidase (beta-lactamase class C family)